MFLMLTSGHFIRCGRKLEMFKIIRNCLSAHLWRRLEISYSLYNICNS